jgi:hypothetical protein
MKKYLFLAAIILMYLETSQAQWQPDVRLTNDPANSYTSPNNAWCMAVAGNTVHVVWEDNRDGNYEIYYKRSIDGGVSWGADTRLTNDSAASQFLSVSVSGSAVHIVWHDNRDGNNEIYYKRSTDDGVSWGADTRLTNNSGDSQFPSASVSDSSVHVVWNDLRDGNSEIYSKRSTNGGVNWGADARLTDNAAVSQFPSVSVSGSAVNVVWHDNRDGNYEIYYKHSTDGGVSWGADTRLTNNSAVSRYPSAAISNSVLHVQWHDNRDGNYEVYYKRSTDGGVTWETDKRLTNSSGSSLHPSVSVSDSTLHIVWHDDRDGNFEIYYIRSTNRGASWGADIQLTSNTATSWYPSVSVSGPVIHVIWHDNRDVNFEIYYKRDPTGNPFGLQIISSEVPRDFSLYQNYPNPFNPNTIIRFQITNYKFTSLKVYDILGREIAILVNQQLQPGTYEISWDASNYPSGVYLFELSSDDFKVTKKMVLVK